jgi:hypothetical protein
MGEDAVTGFIDPPSPFAPRSEWEAFLVELKALPEAPDVTAAITEAEAWLQDNPETAEEDDFGDLED